MDNFVTSVENIGEIKKVQALDTKIMAQGGFNLRGWEISGDTSEELTPIWGLKWNCKSDTLSLGRVFDPICFSGLAILSLKLMLQTLWEMKLYWDTPLDGNYVDILKCLAATSTSAHQNNYLWVYWHIMQAIVIPFLRCKSQSTYC
ncbi:hypothetical protein PR048_009791 [Dryococelus australis]|uniref:Uncharacterized protein n=1 Tax=Dryococelus australis TaxID=614101 RepID=A0ABQ9I0Y1_9NEOP|nr:hypothetical protein PR048_009791 [Dryococelus australis]